MQTYFKRFLRNFDYPLFFTYLILTLFGLVMIYSASMVWAVGQYEWPADYFFKKQIFNLSLAYPVFFLAAFFPYKHFKRKGFMATAVLVMLVLLGLVHQIGYGDTVGAQSWIKLPFGAGSIQPSEVAKLVIIIYFAGVFANKYNAGTIDSLNKSIGPPIIVLTIAVFSIMRETDIGMSFIIILSAFSVIVASGLKKRTFLKMSGLISLCIAAIAAFLYFNWSTIMTGGRKGRIEAFLNPFDYLQTSGYQIANGYIAIGSGGVKGRGLGNSLQKMGYLPEPQTDVIMAVISEELGILGAFIVIGGLGFIVLRALSIAMKTKDPHARMLAAGIGSMIGIQTFVNLGGLMGLIPLTGVTLPFISYGGTSVILLSLSLGILMNISMFVKHENHN
ncbi:FtsW/RodA/SpoVE family cell cycle protein [Sporosarcina sp. FA9]|uniref:FtsW/RodA/SpoVE family cell cycle protein n=1 Tax=Sporosarcina sp. FA9 TaxID=3413030 RepID=UPI003F65B8D7